MTGSHERLYRAAVRWLLPDEFRRDFFVHMQRAFRDQLRDARSLRARTALWLSTLSDLLRTRARLRRDRRNRLDLPTREPQGMDTLLQDIRYGVRSLAGSPSLAALAVITLALGIGANALIFSLVDGVLLRPLPWPEPGRLVTLFESNVGNGWPRFSVSPLNYLDWKEQASSYSELTSYYSTTVTITRDGEPERIQGARVAEGFFATLGVPPALGRAFRDEDHRAGAADVVVLGPRLWARRYASDPDVVGRTILVDGRSTEVVGVVRESTATVPASAEIWLPFDTDGAREISRGAHFIAALGRLAPGVDIEAANAEIEAIAARLPLAERGWSAFAEPLYDVVVGDVGESLWLLFGAVALVLTIACVNVANLLLVRADGRARELSLRAAMGAGRGRLARQVMIEALILALLGVVLALPAAYAGLELVRYGAAGAVPRLSEVAIDERVMAFATVVSTLTALLFGLAPAIRAARLDPAENLKEGERGGGGGRGHVRSLLVVAEVAVAVVVVVAAGLLARSLWELHAVDPGFATESRITARISLPSASYAEDERVATFYDSLLESLRADRGVTTATATSALPMTGGFTVGFSKEGDTEEVSGQSAELRLVDPTYFGALDVPLLQGRRFDETDDLGDEQVVLVNRAFAERFFPDGGAIGARLNIGFNQLSPEEGGPIIRTVVGIVENVREFGLGADTPPTCYGSRRQVPSRSMTVVLESAATASEALPVLRARLAEIDPDLPLYEVATLSEVIRGTTSDRRFRLNLVLSFALLALVLAALGIYGTVAYSVARRTREIGVRVAIGAQPADVMRLVLRNGLLPVLIGLGLGLGAALAAGRVVENMLYGIRPSDPVTLVGVAAGLFAVGAIACWLPARRAMRMDPVSALRSD